MDEMLPFLRAVAANPGDDAPRLAFADWLTEHDQPARADFIRLQIELARTDPADDGYAEKTARMRRCGVLTQKGKHRFFDHLPTKKLKIAFRRGFIEAIDTAGADRIDTSGFDLVPLQALRTGAKHVAKFKGFTRLKWLEYWEKRDAKPAKLLEILGPNGWFKNLETLSLPYLTDPELRRGLYARLAPDLIHRYGVEEARVPDLAGHPRPTLYRDVEGYGLPPHPDTLKKVVTMHLYLPADASQTHLGTALYRREPGPLSRDDGRPSFTIAKQFDFRPNTGYAFVVNDGPSRRSWHGRDPLPAGSGVRNTLLNTFYSEPRPGYSGYLEEGAEAPDPVATARIAAAPRSDNSG